MFESAMLNGAIIGSISAAIIIIMMTIIRKPIKCPNCDAKQPKFRKPTSFRQAMMGGFTCQNCGAEMDARGRLRES